MEALSELADLVAAMNEGRMEQVGSPDEVYNHAATPFVYNFLGNVNLFHGRIDNGQAYIDGEATEKSGNLVFRPAAPARNYPPAQRSERLSRHDQTHQFGRPARQGRSRNRVGCHGSY